MRSHTQTHRNHILEKIIPVQDTLFFDDHSGLLQSNRLSLSGATPHSQGGGGEEGVCLLVFSLLILAQHTLSLSFSVLNRPSSVCDTHLDTFMFCPPLSYACNPLHLTRNSKQLFGLYPTSHSLNPGPTPTFLSLFYLLGASFCFEHPLMARSCFSLSRNQAPCLCLTRFLYIFL